MKTKRPVKPLTPQESQISHHQEPIWEEGDNEFIQSAAIYEGDEDDEELEELEERFKSKQWKNQKNKSF